MWNFIRARDGGQLQIVACRPLYGGGALYVADVDGRRFVFIASQRTACLLARYEAPRSAEGTRSVARLKVHAEC